MANKHVTRDSESALEIIIDGLGSAIATGEKGYQPVPWDCYIEKATIEGTPSGSIVVDIWKCTYSQFDGGSTHPVDGDSITASAPLTISTDTKDEDTDLTGWTRELNKDDVLAYNVDSCSTMEKVTIKLQVVKT